MEKKKKNNKNSTKIEFLSKYKVIILSVFILIMVLCVGLLYFRKNVNEICFEYDNDNTKGVVIYGYKCDFIKDVVIPKEIDNHEVKEIADYAFYNKGLKSVDIQANIRKIGYMSFANNELSNIDIPVETEVIGNFAFKENKIDELVLFPKLTYLGAGAFSFNYIEKLTILENTNEGLKSIGNHAFESNMLRSVKLPNTLETIGDYAFAENTLLDEISIPSGVKEIGACALCYNELNTIINKTGKKFDWNRVLTYGEGDKFMTGFVNINPCDDDNSEDCDIFTEITEE